MVCVPKKYRWYPKFRDGTQNCGQSGHVAIFFDLKNDEKSSFEEMCKGVWVQLGYRFGYHFGYHYNEFLKTKKLIF